jgi:hypothetical protein
MWQSQQHVAWRAVLYQQQVGCYVNTQASMKRNLFVTTLRATPQQRPAGATDVVFKRRQTGRALYE